MESGLKENEVFTQIDFTKVVLPATEYERCSFIECSFNACNFTDITFIDCVFDNCDLSSAILRNTTFNNTQFNNCKLLGMHFNNCNKFLLKLKFNDCQLNYSIFYQMKLKGIVFNNCNLEDTDFSHTDLTESIFNNCNLNMAMFDNTTLEKADLRTATNYAIDPERNKIKQAKFSVYGLAGLLKKHQIEIE